jgi:hypothetical protein
LVDLRGSHDYRVSGARGEARDANDAVLSDENIDRGEPATGVLCRDFDEVLSARISADFCKGNPWFGGISNASCRASCSDGDRRCANGWRCRLRRSRRTIFTRHEETAGGIRANDNGVRTVSRKLPEQRAVNTVAERVVPIFATILKRDLHR